MKGCAWYFRMIFGLVQMHQFSLDKERWSWSKFHGREENVRKDINGGKKCKTKFEWNHRKPWKHPVFFFILFSLFLFFKDFFKCTRWEDFAFTLKISFYGAQKNGSKNDEVRTESRETKIHSVFSLYLFIFVSYEKVISLVFMEYVSRQYFYAVASTMWLFVGTFSASEFIKLLSPGMSWNSWKHVFFFCSCFLLFFSLSSIIPLLYYLPSPFHLDLLFMKACRIRKTILRSIISIRKFADMKHSTLKYLIPIYLSSCHVLFYLYVFHSSILLFLFLFFAFF